MIDHEEQPVHGGRAGANGNQESLDAVLIGWQRAIWWAGVRPMLRRMVDANLTMAESLVLRSLRLKPMTVADAAAHLMLSHSAASRAIDRLVRDGYMAREEDPDDRRQKRLTLSERGTALILAMEGDIANGFHELIGDMGDEDRETMRSIMARTLAARAARLSASGCFHARETAPLTADEATLAADPANPPGPR